MPDGLAVKRTSGWSRFRWPARHRVDTPREGEQGVLAAGRAQPAEVLRVGTVRDPQLGPRTAPKTVG
jgi:hypothetical protein